MRAVNVISGAQLPVRKRYAESLRQMGARVVQVALAQVGLGQADALYLGNMLSDELQGQKHVASLIADEAGLHGVEALQVRAATATGAAALRMAYLAVASGSAEVAVAVGVEKMSSQTPTSALTKALDAEREVPDGSTLVGQNAKLMYLYRQRYPVPEDAFVNFAVNAHRNANHNPNALFKDKVVSAETVLNSRIIIPPIRLYDCSPICDGAAAVVLTSTKLATQLTKHSMRLLASSVATDRFRVMDRKDPLYLQASALSAEKAFQTAGITRSDVDFFEVHDAFTIMACLILEATGFAPAGEGWHLAKDNHIALDGKLPITTMGGLKARGHPIGASAIYQTIEILQQLTGQAGENQLANPKIGMLQSVGGAGSTLLTHIFGRND